MVEGLVFDRSKDERKRKMCVSGCQQIGQFCCRELRKSCVVIVFFLVK